MGFEVVPLPMLQDNYSWALIDHQRRQVAIVDPPEIEPVERLLGQTGMDLELILLTHHHPDHIAGADALRRKYGARIVGARADQHRLPSLDQAVAEGDRIAFGDAEAEVFDTPGHTIGHISYYFAGEHALFCGDTLFSLGCGRLLEGTAAQMFQSLAKFKALPPETRVYCGHEYTEANGRFALSVDGGNGALQARLAQVRELRAAGQPSLPSVLGDEMEANPFMRAGSATRLGELRAAKDGFRG